jgi:formate dehydrogenase accessory protein FdhD
LADSGRYWRIAEEAPVAIVYNNRNYAVMLATPADFFEFAVGFSLTERIADTVADIERVEAHLGDHCADLRIALSQGALERFDLRQQRRNLVGRAGCGLCGVEGYESFFEDLPPSDGGPLEIPPAAGLRAIGELPARQPLSRSARTVHAAAWATNSGDLVAAYEDVGRHNALDKLIGARSLAGETFGEGFLVMSSRCSYEIVEKAARAGVRAILSISAPTAFAIRKAAEAGISLYAGDAASRIV